MTGVDWVRNQDGSQGVAWNPLAGCSKESTGCAHCYALQMTVRLAHNPKLGAERQEKYAQTVCKVGEHWAWSGEIAYFPERLEMPYHWRKPRTVFVGDMTDLFHSQVDADFLAQVWQVMADNPRHHFLILTKRPDRMQVFVSERDVLPNVSLGVTVENQNTADARREALQGCIGYSRYVSFEPALGVVDWSGWEFIQQLISGGESGPYARPSHPVWHYRTRDWCTEHDVTYYFKQHGCWIAKPEIARLTVIGWQYDNGWAQKISGKEWGVLDIGGCFRPSTTTFNGSELNPQDDYEVTMFKVGKGTAGHLLERQEYREVIWA